MTRRIILVFGALLVVALIMSFSLAMAVANTRPGFAASIAPYLSRPKARTAEVVLATTVQSGNTQEAEPLAREAAMLDPMNAAAVRTLAYVYRMGKNDLLANGLFNYANELTRRDLGVNLDYVMEAAKRGDANAAVHHFDVALRTSRGSWDRLFPLIYRLSEDPSIVPALAAVLAKEPQWKWPFLDGLVRDGPNSLVTARLLSELEKAGPVRNDDLHRALIGRLLDDGHYARAFSRYRVFAQQKGIQSLSNGDFDRTPLQLPFEWTALADDTIDAGVADNTTSKSLQKSFYFRVPPSANGELLRLTAVLGPGAHRLSARMGPALEGKAGELTFTAECLGSGTVLEDRTIEGPGGGNHSFGFAIPRNCPAVRLYLKARSLDDASPWVSWLDQLRLDAESGGRI
jgi:hypothetical protein